MCAVRRACASLVPVVCNLCKSVVALCNHKVAYLGAIFLSVTLAHGQPWTNNSNNSNNSYHSYKQVGAEALERQLHPYKQVGAGVKRQVVVG